MRKIWKVFKNSACSIILTLLVLTGFVHPVSFVIIGCVFLAEFLFFLFTYRGQIKIETPDGGDDQPYHPSVLFFKDGFSGHKYWMAFTPLPIGAQPYPDRWECPCVICSNDGVNWKYPNNRKYFLDDLTDNEIADQDYFSDPHLIYNSDSHQIYLYYRLSTGPKKYKDIVIYLRTSYDGINWTDRQQVTYLDSEIEKQRPTSPAFVCSDNGYIMWYVEGGDREHRRIFAAFSKDGLTYEKSTVCNLNSSINPWHIDCQKFDDEYFLTVYDFSNHVTVFKSVDGINFNEFCVLLSRSKKTGSFYKSGLYRTCLVKTDSDYRAYFSAKDGTRVSIGLMQGNQIDKMKVISASSYLKFRRFFDDMLNKYLYVYVKIAKKFWSF